MIEEERKASSSIRVWSDGGGFSYVSTSYDGDGGRINGGGFC
jgi:hypothetical protein